MATNIKILKLITGEELVSEVINDEGSTLKIKNPVRIIMMPNKADPKTPSVGLAPWAEFSEDKEIVLYKSHVLCIMTPIREFINQYNSIFGGIVLPSSKLILSE